MHIYFTITPAISNVYGNVSKNYEIINWIKYMKSETISFIKGSQASIYTMLTLVRIGIVTSYNHDVTITVVFKYKDVTVRCVSLLMVI